MYGCETMSPVQSSSESDVKMAIARSESTLRRASISSRERLRKARAAWSARTAIPARPSGGSGVPPLRAISKPGK